jgi:hypothetical protein
VAKEVMIWENWVVRQTMGFPEKSRNRKCFRFALRFYQDWFSRNQALK